MSLLRHPASTVLVATLALVIPMLGCGSGGGGGGGGSSAGTGGGGGGGGSTTNLIPNATPVTVGTAVVGALFSWEGQFVAREEGLYGLYAATLTGGTRYRIATSNALNGGQDPYLYLMDRTGRILFRDDNSGGAFEAAIEYTPGATDTYIVALRAASRATSGRCDLLLSDTSFPPLPGITLATGATLSNQPFEWQAAYQNAWEGTYAQYVVSLQAQGIYEFETGGTSSTGYEDTVIYLMSPNGAVIAEDDDSAATSNWSKLTFTSQTTGYFALRIRAYNQGDSGTCNITARQIGTAPTPGPRTQLAPGQTLTGQTFAWQSAYANRPDGAYGEYDLPLVGGTTYTITTSNAVGGGGDTWIYLYDLNLVLVDDDDDGAGNMLSKIVFTPAVDATYVVRLRAYTKGQSGTCSLALSSGASGGTPLYPDLRPLADRPSGYMYDARYELRSGGGRYLRFSNANFNGGVGDMALRMINNNGTMIAYQKVTTTTGATQETFAGQFVFATHASHMHYHFDHFNDYNLREVLTNNGVGNIVATSNKVSFCLINIDHFDPTLVGPTNNNYSCNDQGISVGWADVYAQGLDGQDIDIGALADGTYWLESVVDPADQLLETNNGNNVVRIKVIINHGARTVTAP